MVGSPWRHTEGVDMNLFTREAETSSHQRRPTVTGLKDVATNQLSEMLNSYLAAFKDAV